MGTNIVANHEEVIHRRGDLQTLLGWLSRTQIATAHKSRAGGLIWHAFTGSPPGEDWTSSSIQTTKRLFEVRYREYWSPVDSGATTYSLESLYFELYCLRGPYRDPSELAALHWHPEGARSPYAKGPHLHIQDARHPVPKAHLGMDLCDWDNICASLSSLMASLERSIRMMIAEVLDHPDADHLLAAARV